MGSVSYDQIQNGERGTVGNWQPWLLNAGVWQLLENDEGQKVRMPIFPTNEEGDQTSNTPVSEPWPLSKEGQAIPLAEIKDKVEWFNPQMFGRSSFANFQFDFTLVLSDEFLEQKGF